MSDRARSDLSALFVSDFLFARFDGNVSALFGDCLVAGADDLAAVGDLFHSVCRPARNARNGKEGRIQFPRKIEHIIDKAREKVYVGADALVDLALFRDELRRHVRDGFSHLVFFLHVLFYGELFRKRFEDIRARVGEGIHRVPHAVDEPRAVERLFVEHFRKVVFELSLVKIGHVRLDVVEHLAHFDVRAAVFGSFEGAEGSCDGGICIRSRRGDDVRRESGVVAAAVFRVEHEAHIQRFCFEFRVAFVGTHEAEEVLCGAEFRLRLVNYQAAVRMVVRVNLVAVGGEQRELREQLYALTQDVGD